MYYNRSFDDKFTPGNVNYREAESNYRNCSYCQHYMSENGSCAYVGGKILSYYVCDLQVNSNVKLIPETKMARRKKSIIYSPNRPFVKRFKKAGEWALKLFVEEEFELADAVFEVYRQMKKRGTPISQRDIFIGLRNLGHFRDEDLELDWTDFPDETFRKNSGKVEERLYVEEWADGKIYRLTEEQLIKELKDIYRDWQEAKEVLDRLGYFGKGFSTFYTEEYYGSGEKPSLGKELVLKIKKELSRLGNGFSVTFNSGGGEGKLQEEDGITIWDHRMIPYSFPVPFAETALLRELKKLGHYSYDEEQISSFLSSMVRKIPSNSMLNRMFARKLENPNIDSEILRDYDIFVDVVDDLGREYKMLASPKRGGAQNYFETLGDFRKWERDVLDKRLMEEGKPTLYDRREEFERDGYGDVYDKMIEHRYRYNR